MLTKNYIEQELAKSEYSDQIRKSLSNYYEGLDENVAIAIDFRRFDRAFCPDNVQSVVSLLREQGIDAVSFMDKEAASPDKYVITKSGVLCPNMKPEDALKATVYIEDLLLKNDYQLLGHANPQTAKSLIYTSSRAIGVEADKTLSANASNSKAIDIKNAHPNIEEFNQIEAKHGGDYKSFIDEMVSDAYAKSETVDFKEMSEKNVYEDGGKYLYRGGSLGNNPYATISEFNSRKVAHSSPAIDISGSFSGKGGTSSTKGGAFYPPTSDNIQYGFIYEFESMGDEQIYYHNVGLEEGNKPRVLSDTNKDWNGHDGQIYETPVLPHHNKVHAIYLHVGKQGENKLYSVPLDENGNIADEKWRDFFEMHEPSDDKVVGYVADRQDKIKSSPDVVYEFKTGEKLPPKNYTDLSAVPADEFLKAFVHRDALTTDGSQITCKESLNLDFLGVEKIPNLSNVTINGRFNANQVQHVNMNDLPFTSKGYFLVDATIDNCDKVDAETFCRKLGMEYKDGMWNTSNTHISGKFVGCPQNFANTPIKDLNFIDLTVNDLNEIPVTKSGANGIKITNQESIRDMSPDLFIRKIVGDNYDKFPSGKTFNPDYKLDLNLACTNIVELPKGLDNYKIESIVFPENAVVKSLDNIPITKEGCYGLKYSGDLSKETMESFLLKTKGIDWCANNLAKAADGHLIVNGELDFNTKNYSSYGKSNLDISSFPKDIDKVEFKGKIGPSELNQSLNHYLNLQSQKNKESIYVHNNKEFNYDLSDFKAKDVDVRGNFKSIKLPEGAEKVSFSDIDNLKLSSVNLSDKVKEIHLRNVKSFENLDLSKQSNIYLYNSKLSSVKFPDKCDGLSITNTKLNEAVKLPSQANRIELSNANFGKGCTLELLGCKFLELSNCNFPEGSNIDLSKCQRVTLSNVDLSKVNIKLPEQGKIYINENVKFAPDRKLDFSKCQEAIVHPSTECSDIKLPAKGDHNPEHTGKLHKNVKEVTAEYILNHRLSAPKGVKIIDAPTENGKKVSLKLLSKAGVLSKEQIADLRKERLLSPVKSVYNKFKTIGKADSWRPENKTAAKIADKAGAVPIAAVVASGVAAYEQYKSGDKEGAAATLGKGVVHASVQGVAASAGINVAAKSVSKTAEKVTEKVVSHQAAKTASKQAAKAAGKAAGKAVGKSILKKIPLVSLGAGAYFAYERAKNGEWKKAGCELLSGTLGCFPGVGTAASVAVDCGLAVADTKQAIADTKKQQAQANNQKLKAPQRPKLPQKSVAAQQIETLSGRAGAKPNYAVQSAEQTKTPQANTQAQTKAPQANTQAQTPLKPNTAAAISQPVSQTSAPLPKVADMSKKEKGTFFHNLRMGVNSILAAAEKRLSAVQSVVKTQTKTQTQTKTPQQPSILQMKMTKNKGNGL